MLEPLSGLKLDIYEFLRASADPAGEAAELLGVVAAAITVQVGRLGASAVVYAIADQVATGPEITSHG